jgi:hypothetical protein
VGIRKISAWAEPEQIHMLKTVDCEHESRMLKNDLISASDHLST